MNITHMQFQQYKYHPFEKERTRHITVCRLSNDRSADAEQLRAMGFGAAHIDEEGNILIAPYTSPKDIWEVARPEDEILVVFTDDFGRPDFTSFSRYAPPVDAMTKADFKLFYLDAPIECRVVE